MKRNLPVLAHSCLPYGFGGLRTADRKRDHVSEVTTRGGRAIALAAEHPALRTNVHDYLSITPADRFFAPILLTLPAQLIAYHMGVARGVDPDFPRNLSKTLTVDQP